TNTGALDVFDPAAGVWAPRHAMPTARGGAAGAVVGGLLVVAGGEGNPAAASGVFATVEIYDPSSDSWSPGPPMATPRHGTGAAALGDAMIVPGGATHAGFGATDVVEELTVRPAR